MTEQPRDARGRVSPDPSWPADRAAPGPLELVRRFCNTVNRESGADRLDEPGGLGRWLCAEGLPPLPDRDLPRITSVREHLHGLARAHATGEPGPDLPALAALVDTVRFAVTAGPEGLQLGVAAPGGVDAFLGRLALAVVDAGYRGTWPRLKACAHCGWVVYDGSRNRSARWCSMTVCGGRENARAYRRRRSGV